MQKRLIIIAAVFPLLFNGHVVCAEKKPLSLRAGSALVEAKVFPVKGPTEGLEPQKLDFRYAPGRWQACIGLPDDPHKSIVGSDGGLYYDYGGGRFYGFGTRILADLETQGQKSKIEQSLWHPRIPIVVTEQNFGDLTLQQEAWAGAPYSEDISQWSPRRVDYLWLKVTNNGARPQKGRIVLQIDAKDSLIINDDKTRLLERGNPNKTFCVLSPACSAFSPPDLSEEDTSEHGIEMDHSPGVNKNWAQPNVACHSCFRDIMVGNARPLVFKYRAEPNKKYRVAFGLIEGWHNKAGVRPLEIRIEGKVVRSVDLIGEYGKNTPVVLLFDTKDENGDGKIEMGVYSPKDAEDKNTILSGLWVFDAKAAVNQKDVLADNLDKRALAVMFPQETGKAIKLLFEEKQLAPGQEYGALITFYQGDQASIQTDEKQAKRERDRAIKYWQNIDLPYDRMTVPDLVIQGLLDSCIRNIYQARELRNGQPAFQVGPTCYRGTWAADGPFILESITYLGRGKETRAGLQVQVDKDEGPGGVQFSKKSGLRLWMIWRHAQLTGDWNWLENMWPKIEQNVNQIISYRRMTLDDPTQVNYGLMPPGFGDGGLGGVHREYTNVYWTLAGLRAAIEMAEKLNKQQIRSKWQTEYRDYWQVFDKARNRDKLTDSFGNIYVPVTMKGEQQQLPQRGAWAFLQSIFPGRIFDPDDKLMLGTLSMLDSNQQEGLIYGTGWIPDGIWNYAASFYGHAHIWLDHGKKAAATLYAFGNHACPLLCWREEQNPQGQKEHQVGDMPHNWASAEFIRMVRHLLILERGDELHLLHGLPHAWTRPANKTKMLDIPTSYGPLSLTLEMTKEGDSATIEITPPRRDPPKKIKVHLEHFQQRVEKTKMELRDGNFIIKVDFE
ncbi:MAG: hypothetical protein ACYSW3_23030 [Planctomycetota bacterium]|jgi:hypothetical protein